MPSKYWIALFAALLLNAAANLLIKSGMRDVAAAGGLTRDGVLNAMLIVLTNWKLVIGLLFFGSNFLFYMFALQKIDISVGYPIMTTVGFVIILVVAAWQFGEQLHRWQWLGIVMIIGGVWLVAANNGHTPTTEAATAQTASAEQEQTSDDAAG